MNQYPQQGPPRKGSSDKLLKIIGCIVLVVVVPIVLIITTAILASIALPMYADYKRRAEVIQTDQAMMKVGNSLADLYVQNGSFPEFEDTDTLSEVTGVPLQTEYKEYTMDSTGNVVAIRTMFVGGGYVEGSSLLLMVDCSSQPCKVEMTPEGGRMKDYLRMGDDASSNE